MLTELTLQRYKAHKDTRVPLARLTVLVGPNASGKTSALEALRVLSGAAPVLDLALRQGATLPMRLGCAGETRGKPWSRTTGARDPDYDPEDLRPATFLRLDARRLGEPSHSDEEVPVLAEDGYGLATVLTALKVASNDRFHALEGAARRVVPRLRGLALKRTRQVERLLDVLTTGELWAAEGEDWVATP
jgi:hypothetical protein